jgi:hypothetical protein
MPGALAVEPLFMLDPLQWGNYASVTRGMHLYEPFGSWVGAMGETAPRAAQGEAAAPIPRLRGLRDATRKRSRAAGELKRRLLKAAAPLWEKVLEPPPPSRGRPPRRRELGRLLKDQGVSVTARQLAWLMGKLTPARGRDEKEG